MDYPYWHEQTIAKPLFPDLEWNKPQTRALSGRMVIVGGNKLGFKVMERSYNQALREGAGEAKILLPDALKSLLPRDMIDIVLAPSTPSGGLSTDAAEQLKALGQWGSLTLFIGDAGKNSQTSLLYTDFLRQYDKPVLLARDAVDLVMADMGSLLNRPSTAFIVSFAQLQKVFRSVYYPKVLTFSMQLNRLVEALHKFTLTFSITIVTFHADQLIVAHDGEITTTTWRDPMSIWDGSVSITAALYYMWNPAKPLETMTASFVSK